MNLPKQTTSKLFFGKWPYKIRCYCAGSWMIKRVGIPETIDYCTGNSKGVRFNSNIDKVKLLKFISAIDPFLDKEIQVRVEGGIFSIYCKDVALFDKMSTELSTWINMIYTPATPAEEDYMINATNKRVMCNDLPFNKYKYKVYIKQNMPLSMRSSFNVWSKHYIDKIKPTSSAKNWFNGVNSYNPLVIYVLDQPTLSMVGLFLGSNLSKVEEFIPRSSINSITDQEKTCQHLVKV